MNGPVVIPQNIVARMPKALRIGWPTCGARRRTVGSPSQFDEAQRPLHLNGRFRRYSP